MSGRTGEADAPGLAGRVSKRLFGTLPGGEAVFSVTLANRFGMRVSLISYGAAIQSVLIPRRHGEPAEVTLGHPDLQPYLDCPQYAGASVGRVANRTAGGRFVLDGITFRLTANDGPHSLHGGARGFDKANWRIAELGEDRVRFAHTSPDGEEGYPGTLEVSATYRLEESGRLSVEYLATTDAPTLVNLTNHAHWNLAGAGSGHSAMRHELAIAAGHYLPVDDRLIPTGERRPVEGTVFDFRQPAAIMNRVRSGGEPQLRPGRGFDHNWVLDGAVPGRIRQVASLRDPWSSRAMAIDTNQPGLQFYSGNFFDGSVAGHGGWLARMGDFVALEPQAFPDTANQPGFGSIRLDPGETYRNVIGWSFSASQEREI